MHGKKKLLMVLLMVLVFGSVLGGLLWHQNHYLMIGFQFYRKDLTYLDLRGQEITVAHYQKLSRRLPDCRIRWDVPLSGGSFDQDSPEIRISVLNDQDVERMDYLEKLQIVHAEGCTDYAQLRALQQRRPEVKVRYTVHLGAESYAQSVSRIDVENLRAEELTLMENLPNLKTVICSGGEVSDIAALRSYCLEKGLDFGISLGGKLLEESVSEVEAKQVTERELNLLQFLPNLKTLQLEEPKAPAQALIHFRTSRPEVEVVWEKEICGVLCTSEDTEIDLSQGSFETLDQVEADMVYFPDAESVFLGKQKMDNEILADYRERVREDYKVVWVVELGTKLTSRTDATTFMPVREHVYYFNDEEAYNLRYCEDMVCMDIGHMSISKLDFLEFMPELEYLVLAHTQVQYIEPIRHCQKLKFLELDWSPIRDYSPLADCKALEDLNLGNTYADFEPVGKMTWLKNLWMIGCSRGPAYRMTQVLPETRVMVSGSATVANGWRDLKNYYAMRDLLQMPYMSW